MGTEYCATCNFYSPKGGLHLCKHPDVIAVGANCNFGGGMPTLWQPRVSPVAKTPMEKKLNSALDELISYDWQGEPDKSMNDAINKLDGIFAAKEKEWANKLAVANLAVNNLKSEISELRAKIKDCSKVNIELPANIDELRLDSNGKSTTLKLRQLHNI